MTGTQAIDVVTFNFKDIRVRCVDVCNVNIWMGCVHTSCLDTHHVQIMSSQADITSLFGNIS